MARYNDEGGVLGRQLEVVVETYSPVGSTGTEAACVIHTEDEEVFAFVGSMREDNILCYTQVHDTIAVNNLAITYSATSEPNVDQTAEVLSDLGATVVTETLSTAPTRRRAGDPG